MVSVHVRSPDWFFGADATLEAFAAVIAFLVALAAYRAYRMSTEQKYAYFTTSFILLTFSFLARAITDAIIEGLIFNIPEQQAATVFYIGYVAHILLALTAYLTLIFITHKVTDKRIIALLFLIMVPSLILSGSYYLSFYGLSTIFLLFITLAYYQNYRKVCKPAACLVFIAFALLTTAQILFIAEGYNNALYAPAHIAQAIGYLTIFFALLKTRTK